MEDQVLNTLASQLADRARALMGAVVSDTDPSLRQALTDALRLGGSPQLVVTLLANQRVHIELSVNLDGAARVPFFEGMAEAPLPGTSTSGPMQ